MQIILKLLTSALMIVAVTEIGKRTGKLGGLILSLPITSLIAFMWLWKDTHNLTKISALSIDTIKFLIPSVVLFILLPVGIKYFGSFWIPFAASIAATMGAYFVFFKFV